MEMGSQLHCIVTAPLLVILSSSCPSPAFSEEETEVQTGEVTRLSSYSCRQSRSQPGPPEPETFTFTGICVHLHHLKNNLQ